MTKAAGALNIISGATHFLGAVFILIFGWLGDGVFNSPSNETIGITGNVPACIAKEFS
jgi:hypothetical protein